MHALARPVDDPAWDLFYDVQNLKQQLVESSWVIIIPIGGSGGKHWFGECGAAADSGQADGSLGRPALARRHARCSIPGLRSRIDTIEADDDGNRRIWPTEVSPPRRSLPPSSDVQHQQRLLPNRRPATPQLACVERCSSEVAAVPQTPRRVPPPTACLENIAPPGRAGRWRGVSRGPTFWLRTRLHADKQRGGPKVLPTPALTRPRRVNVTIFPDQIAALVQRSARSPLHSGSSDCN